MASQAVAIRGAPSTQAGRGQTLTEIYYQWFDVVACTTPERIRESMRLRYQVYCVETGFLPAADNPGDLERDPSDDHSISSLLIHKSTGMVAGTVRLILPQPKRPHFGLPAYQVSDRLVRMSDVELPRERTAEISRFAISKEFRRRASDTLYASHTDPADYNAAQARILPSITIGLMQAIVRMTRESGMTHVVSVTEPALSRLLFQMGIVFSATGEKVDYHGARLPGYRDMTCLLAEIHHRRPEIWDAITHSGQIWPLEGPYQNEYMKEWVSDNRSESACV